MSMSIIRGETRALRNIDSAISAVRKLIAAGSSEYQHVLSRLLDAREHYEFIADMRRSLAAMGSAPAEPASHKSEREPDPAGLDGGGEAGHTPG
jgi:hypothetical protein